MRKNILADTSKYSTFDANAIRLTFSYEEDEINLISKQKIKKFVGPAAPKISSKFWYELTNSQNNTIYTQNLGDIIRNDIEIYSTDPNDTGFVRHKLSRRKGVFSIVIPDIPDSTGFELFKKDTETDQTSKIEEKRKIFHLDIIGDHYNQ